MADAPAPVRSFEGSNTIQPVSGETGPPMCTGTSGAEESASIGCLKVGQYRAKVERRRAVQDKPEGTVVAVIDEQHHRPRKKGTLQRGSRDQEAWREVSTNPHSPIVPKVISQSETLRRRNVNRPPESRANAQRVLDGAVKGLRRGARLVAFPAYLAGVLGRWTVEQRWDPDHREARLDAYRHRVSGRILSLFGVILVRGGSSPSPVADEGWSPVASNPVASNPVASTTVRSNPGASTTVRSNPGASHLGSDPARPRLIIANHRTALDIGILLHELGGSFLSRADLRDWPLVGKVAREADTIFVDRANRSSGASAIRAMRRRLRGGKSVMVFPEGVTCRGDVVQPFQAGAFVAVRGLDVDIVPVGLAYPHGIEYVDQTFVEHVGRLAARRRTMVGVAVGEPIRAEGKPSEIAQHCHREVQALVYRAREHVDEISSRTTPLARLTE